MVEPTRANSRRTLGGGVAAAVALAGAGFILGRNTGERVTAPAPAPTSLPRPAPVATPSAAPIIIAPLGRADLIAAVRLAADAAASDRVLPPEVAALDGRQFEIRLPFGCSLANAADAALSRRYDRDSSTLRVSARPQSFDPAAWLGAERATKIDSIEGFWIERPWTTSEACPPGDAGDPPSASPEQTLAVVDVHGAGESRVGRRDGEAFEAVERVAPDAVRLERGLRLRLTGRLAGAPDGAGPVICRATTARPVCLVMAAFDEVAIENPAAGSTLATWEVSTARTSKE